MGVAARGPGARLFQGVPDKAGEARWMDNDEVLAADRREGTLELQATKYPYGTNTVVRVARLAHA